jgi:hypothetical protein
MTFGMLQVDEFGEAVMICFRSLLSWGNNVDGETGLAAVLGERYRASRRARSSSNRRAVRRVVETIGCPRGS